MDTIVNDNITSDLADCLAVYSLLLPNLRAAD
jgi:hypothetical protein